ncbi:MAG: hypothetical protein K5650_01245 [Bacteroidales bacterium]|nr:hypothetical protein [Bacteroidales bacterium]
MKTIIIVIIAAVLCVGAMMAGLGVKMLVRKSHEFRRPCANADPTTGRCANCKCHEINHK